MTKKTMEASGTIKGEGLMIASHSLHMSMASQQETRMRVWAPWFQRRSEAFKRYLLQHPWELPMMAINLAAVQVQRVMRGALCRMDPRKAHRLARQAEVTPQYPPFNDIAETEDFVIYHVAALQIQRAFRDHYEARLYPMLRDTRPIELHQAARFIQRCWKRFCDRAAFLARLDILRFRNNQDPALLLRSINPGEAQLFDKAARIVLRFRFGGRAFPPQIYYKVFTQAPLCDVGAFAPRDYTRTRRQLPRELHNHPSSDMFGGQHDIRVGSSRFAVELSAESKAELGQPEVDPESLGWYARHENNGWRCVSHVKLQEIDADPVTKQTRDKRVAFHFSKPKRQENKLALQKRRRREWMQKMYAQGRASSGVRGPSEDKQEEKEEKSFLDERTGEEEDFDDDNLDELLEWTNQLDFEDYVSEWHTSATSFDKSIAIDPRV
ncbi:Hypothetical Protein FCC1311_001562 [Hondaea fermentalgiana]|uniref:Uncharacterized protein n=1 Tax=Hondaea fermentalgiana TaxID=2315210 RepID=A0A2R5FYV9_9STRA|nr:Hypothetical Protein FCC1311_001562 [Hondaea fermentalgiana]|eukprot:GBG23937.1 Hypothetical Protein FCC1311_001562 [Hondaea fermentalgiana]